MAKKVIRLVIEEKTVRNRIISALVISGFKVWHEANNWGRFVVWFEIDEENIREVGDVNE